MNLGTRGKAHGPGRRLAAVKRRALLGLLAAASAGCSGSVPGATGPRTPPPPGERTTARPDGVSVESWDFEETDGGALRVFGTLRNPGDSRRTATVVVTVTVAGEDHTRRSEVTVPAGGTAEFGVAFDVRYEAFTRDGSINLELA